MTASPPLQPIERNNLSLQLLQQARQSAPAEAIPLLQRALDLPCPDRELRTRLRIALGQALESVRRRPEAAAMYRQAGLDSGLWPDLHSTVTARLSALGENLPTPTAHPLRDHFLERMRHAENKLHWSIPLDVLRNGRVLDIGCGLGGGVLGALEAGAGLAVGLDRSLQEFSESPFPAIAAERGHDPARHLLLEGDLFQLKFGEPGFDVVMMIDVIEHVPEPERFLAYAHTVLRPGGYLLLDTCPLYYSALGHHAWGYLPKAEYPWVHLWKDAAQHFDTSKMSGWMDYRIAELNRATHAQIRTGAIAAGFEITLEHETQPSAEDLALYEKFADRIDHTQVPEQADLFRDWILLVARKN